MIFKTFNSDSDKVLSKIGILGKSFEQIGISIRQRKIEIDNLMGAMSKKDAKAEAGGFWSYIFGNESIKEKPIDLSKFIELDKIKASNLLKSLQEIEIASKTNTSVWQEYFSTLSDGQKWQIEFVKNNDLQKTSTEDLVKANQQARASALAHNEAIKAQTLSAKAGKVALQALAMAGNMIAMWGITEVVSAIYSCATASDRLKESASDLGSQFSSTKSDIEGYKTKINDLYKTINDSSSSYEDTYNARQELLTIQDEMIEKFGSEAEAVQLVTAAINGQTEALDSLAKQKWQETVNEFTNGSDKKWTERVGDSWANLWSGVSNNFDRMIKDMENTEVSFRVIPRYDDEGNYEEFSKKLKENFGASIAHTERDDVFTISGDLDDIYDKLLNIQSLATNMGIDESFLPDLSRQADKTKKTLDSYQEIYNHHILYDKIFDSNAYEQSFNDINDAYKKYQDAFASGNEESIEKAKQSFAEIVQGATEGISDKSVVDYFNSMYPDLQEVVGGWEFEVKFKAAMDDSTDNFENEVKDAVGKFDNSESVLNFHSNTATQEQIDAYSQLKNVADEYDLTLAQLIVKLEQLGLISSDVKKNLRDKLSNGTQDLVIDNWVASLTDEEIKMANSTAFDEALKRQKESLNGAALSAENYSDALDEVKNSQNKIDDIDLTPSININGVVAGIEKQVKPVMDAIQSAWADAYDDEGVFKIDPSKALDAVNQVKSAIDSINSEEGLGIQIDTSSIEELANVLTDTSATEEEVRQAYSNIADAVMNEFLPAMDGMDDAHIRVMQTFLEGLGIMNAEEMIIQQLGYSYETYTAAEQVAAQAGIDLANATIEDVMRFAEESTAAEEDKIALLDYYQYKLIASGATIDTSGTITQLLAEYEQLGINCEKLKEYLGLHGAGAGSKVDLKHKGYSSSTEGYDTGANTKPKLPEIPKGIDDRRAKAAKSAAKAAKEEADVMSELNSEMDKLQSAYKSLCDIKDTYNKYGKITVDQYQELTNMGFNFLANLVDENGQLGLNASAFERLAQAKLQEMQIQMARNATDTINGLKTEAEAVEYLTFANEKLRDAALGAAEAQLETAVAAAKVRGEQQGLAAEEIYKGYQASKQMAGNVDFFFDPAALEKEEKENSKEDKTDKLLEAYNKEKAVLEHMLAMDQISKSEYYERLMALVKQYFEGDPEHQDQIWEVEEGYHDYLESIKETYNWIEIFLDNLAKKANALIDKASKFISWSKKNAMINRAVKATDKQITGQTNAYAYYAEKARKVGLNNAYIDKIQNGTLTMEDMQNEALSGKIEKYQEWLIV